MGFYGQPLAIALSRLQRSPVILDAFVSTYETLCEDRAVVRPGSVLGRIAERLDRASTRLAAQVVTDTEANARYFHERFGVPWDKVSTVYVGCDDTIFYPRARAPRVGDRIEVFYYGSFLPLQGVDTIVRAAAQMGKHPGIHITIGGSGREYARVTELAASLKVGNVQFVGWIPLTSLPDYIARADICLGGHFSTSRKAAKVISTKTFQYLAMQRATVVGANEATAELFRYGHHVVAVPMGDPGALAGAILRLARDPQLRGQLADAGHRLYQDELMLESIADGLRPIVEAAACA